MVERILLVIYILLVSLIVILAQPKSSAEIKMDVPSVRVSVETTKVVSPTTKMVSQVTTLPPVTLPEEPKPAPIPAPKKKTVAAKPKVSVASAPSAQSILNGYIARYPILKGVTVSYGNAAGYQAIVYYESGRIIISKNHTAPLSRIIWHECLHIIDWRQDGDIDSPD